MKEENMCFSLNCGKKKREKGKRKKKRNQCIHGEREKHFK